MFVLLSQAFPPNFPSNVPPNFPQSPPRIPKNCQEYDQHKVSIIIHLSLVISQHYFHFFEKSWPLKGLYHALKGLIRPLGAL